MQTHILPTNLCRAFSRSFPVKVLGEPCGKPVVPALPPVQLFVNFSAVCRFYPATRAESLLESKGMRAWIVAPPLGCELIESSPCTNRKRSCMLVRPSPGKRKPLGRSKREPLIRMRMWLFRGRRGSGA